MEKSKVIEKLFFYIVNYSYLILPVLFLISRQKKLESKILAAYGVVFFLLLFFFYDIPKDYRKLYNTIFTFLEYGFFTSFFYINIESKVYRKTIVVLSILFVLFQITHYLVVDNFRIDSIPIGVESILIFIYIFLFFLENMNTPKEAFIYTHYCFWISVGLLIYLGGSFFINILANSLSKEEFDKYWFLNYVADTIKTFLFAIALILVSKTSSTKIKKTTSIPYLDLT